MTEELTGLELRRAVAEKIGWTDLFVAYSHQHNGQVLFGYRPGGDAAEVVPHYEASTDACFRDLMPWAHNRRHRLLLEEVLLAGWIIDADGKLAVGPNLWVATFFHEEREKRSGACYGEAETAAVAICKAVVELAERAVKSAE